MAPIQIQDNSFVCFNVESTIEQYIELVATESAVDWVNSLNTRARGTKGSVDNFLHLVHDGELDETHTRFRTHWLKTDPAGKPRLTQLAERLADEVVDYCIPRDRIEEASKHYEATGSTSKLVALHREARELFTSLEKSGEGGELLLYFLLEVGLAIPQILCKMALKTSSQMHVHGVDGVHASALPEGELAVYWGESKIYDDFGSAASACLESIAPYLLDDGTGPTRRDILLVRDHLSTGDSELSLQLARFFTSDTPEASKLHVRGACLIGFSRDEYASPFLEDGTSVVPNILAEVDSWRQKILARVKNKNVDSIEIELFCLPLPSADEFRAAMRGALGLDGTSK